MGPEHLKQTLNYSPRESVGPWAKFCCCTKRPPMVECITEVEKVCQKLEQGVADELRGRVKTILKKAGTPRKNITQDEQTASGELKKG